MSRWHLILLLLFAAFSSSAITRQTLSWDACGRLHSVTERDASNSGYNWTAMYDGFNRRLSTTSVLVTNGVAFTSLPTTINSYYDPQVEFLELGVAYGKTTEWKLMGQDLNGQYGGMNGTGGLDAVSPYLNQFNPVISDFRGNILGVVTNSVVSWNPARPTGYGAVPGYRPLALGSSGASVALSSAWRGRWLDITGYHQIGARTYDPIAGNWLSYDPVWNAKDPNYLTFCGGDPINGFDHDGRMSQSDYEQQYNAFAELSGDHLIGDFFDQSTGFRSALQNSGQSWSDLSYSDRMSALNLLVGGTWSECSYNYSGPTRSTGSSIANAVWNTDLLEQSWDEWQNRDFSTGIGTATAVTAGAGLVFGGADAIVNSIPIIGTGKAFVENAIKVGVKDLTKTVVEDSAKIAADVEVPQVLRNAANGRAFEQQGLNYLQTVNSDVAGQVSIRPFTASGDLADFRVRLDALGTDNTGNINLYDFKSSENAGFTPNQQVGYPLLNQYGGQVVGGNGGRAYPVGMVIPPTPVTVIRPGGF